MLLLMAVPGVWVLGVRVPVATGRVMEDII